MTMTAPDKNKPLVTWRIDTSETRQKILEEVLPKYGCVDEIWLRTPYALFKA